MSQNRTIKYIKHEDRSNLAPHPAWVAFFKEARRLAVLAEARRHQKQQMETVANQGKAHKHDEKHAL